jgi:aminoglycoside/choline kinase family phosphotransferase
MVPVKVEQILATLFESWSGESPYLVLPLAPSGSQRVYYRLQGQQKTAIGAYNPNVKENQAFISYSQHFKAKGLPVPEIYAVDLDQHVYLQEDLGSTTLYSYLLQKGEYFPDYLVQMYRKAVEQLAHLQIEGGRDLDYSVSYPRASFDRQSMIWDFNTFKYYFLKLAYVPFDEQALEEDFQRLADFLLQADCNHFMYRDFQSRNIMIKSGQPYFIDYQGGRKGALQYDLASLLYQAKAGMPEDIREELLEHYMKVAGQLIHIDRDQFIQYYYGYVLIRSIQTFGTYGYRGLYERKEYFLESIPFALRNVKWILENITLPIALPEFSRAIYHLIASKRFEPFDKIKGSSSFLTVTINSFSYGSTGIPEDTTGNGGGFVFDCRCINNPGRYEPYKKLTGRDEPVINFLKHHSHMGEYLNNVYRLANEAVEDYIERSFTHLQINFGCTGGQHRSVYAADALAKHLKDKYGVKIVLNHLEQERKNWQN